MTGGVLVDAVWTVGQVADELGVTVRTLHHYDEIGLLHPSERTPAGYRLYTGEDLERLQNIVVYRRLGFPLEEIGELLDTGGADLESHLRRQRAAVMSRLDELGELVTAIDRALEKEMSGLKLTKEEQRELFGDGYSEEYAAEAEERWGDSVRRADRRRRGGPAPAASASRKPPERLLQHRHLVALVAEPADLVVPPPCVEGEQKHRSAGTGSSSVIRP